MTFEFLGYTHVNLELDLEEFSTLSVSETVDAIDELLRDEHPEIHFNLEDIVLAANTIKDGPLCPREGSEKGAES